MSRQWDHGWDIAAGIRRGAVRDDRGRGAADVAYFAGFGLRPADRRAWELVAVYHTTLLACGVEHYGVEQC